MRRYRPVLAMVVLSLLAALPASAQCDKARRVVHADVVALDQLLMLNRIGAAVPEGMVFALRRDVESTDGSDRLQPGKVRLKAYKRPRPIVLRVNQYDCLEITFTNYLGSSPTDPFQPATRAASIHVNGMQLYQISDDGSFVGANPSSLVQPGKSTTYRLYATEQNTFLLYSMGAVFGGFNASNDGAQQTAGLFGAVHVEPPDAEWYRSQITEAELRRASKKEKTQLGQPMIDYGKVVDGVPVLRMYTTNAGDTRREIVYTDLTAVITGANQGDFDPHLFPCNNPNGPDCLMGVEPAAQKTNPSNCPAGIINPNFACNYAEPDRIQPYREFTIIYHELFDVVQSLPEFYQTDLQNPLIAVSDQFAINYGTGGIGAEILANRLGIGPMGGCPDCKYEEFFLDSWTVGDPSMLVDVPANAPCTATTMNLANATNATQSAGLLFPPNAGSNATVNAPPLCAETTGTMVNGLMLPRRKATKAFYPDDPSNVYHSYLNDHVKFRILHGGTGFSHVHHQHAHQWLRTPNNNESTYLDSQLINPGSAYTLEITFGGSGNRNKTVGDSIFHCHFYPHFAGGMWSLWRVHDTFEPGTKLDKDGIPIAGYARALPDAEIERGTPTPAIVPVPTIPMAPMPAAVRLVPVKDPGNPANLIGNRVEVKPEDMESQKNPGYPFFIPGISGVRAPHPPMDFAELPPEEGGELLDGGLPRHLILTGTIKRESHNRFDFTKDLDAINAYRLPEVGTPVENVAMLFHERCYHDSFTPEGKKGQFETNGLPRAKGAPYADPALKPYNPNNPPTGNDRCRPVLDKDWTRYRAAVFQTDLVFNKQGWHYPQSRILALWEDVKPTLDGDRPPEPLFFRTESDNAVEYWHTNLVPAYYELDDFQVRTPTDIIGQHIHLVKFDVTSSDGASNGFNYEDGTFSPDEVRDRIESINKCGGLASGFAATAKCGSGLASRKRLEPKAPPQEICGKGVASKCPKDWWGAQTTVQRWMADPLKSPAEDPKYDRTLRTVFTHDHFGPSTHQQTGLYAAFIVEPPDTDWFQSEKGVKLYTRNDGGPTSWEAVVVPKPGGDTPTPNSTYREFALAVQDFQLAYQNTSRSSMSPTSGWVDPANPISQSNVTGSSFFNLNPQGVSAGPTQGTYTFNYRNEPLPFRLQSAASGTADCPQSSDARSTDLSYVFASNVPRNNCQAAIQPPLDSPINTANPTGFRFPKQSLTYDMQPGDPFTPMLRAYQGDPVQVRLIVGAHMLPHPFTFQGVRWLFEPGDLYGDPREVSLANSGYRNNQAAGISEHFEFFFDVPFAAPQANKAVDYLYMPDSSNPQGGRGIVDGTWGLMRAYQTKQNNLMPLPTNPPPTTPPSGPDWSTICTSTKSFTIAATNGSITLNSNDSIGNANALVYQLVNNNGSTSNLPAAGSEPVIIRANAGDCINVTFQNNFTTSNPIFQLTTSRSWSSVSMTPSTNAGVTPALLSYDATTSSGLNVGFNPATTAASGSSVTYKWYAGAIDNKGKATPIEFGAVNLTPSDPIMHDTFGLVGALVIEPKGVTACPDTGTGSLATANVYEGSGCSGKFLFRELVVVTQDNLSQTGSPACTLTTEKDGTLKNSCNTGSFSQAGGNPQVAMNYRAEPMSNRFGGASLNTTDLSAAFSNTQTGSDPQTPILAAPAGAPVRIHMFHPGGSSDQQVFAIHGHIWQDEPWEAASTRLGFNPESPWIGQRDIYGTNSAYSLLLPSAGGAFGVPGDYLYRTHPANFLGLGLWGLLRVSKSGTASVAITSASYNATTQTLTVNGSVGPMVGTQYNTNLGQLPTALTVTSGSQTQNVTPSGTSWSATLTGVTAVPTSVTATLASPFVGSATSSVSVTYTTPSTQSAAKK